MNKQDKNGWEIRTEVVGPTAKFTGSNWPCAFDIPSQIVVEKLHAHEEEGLTGQFHPQIDGRLIKKVTVNPEEIDISLKDGRLLIFKLGTPLDEEDSRPS